jgi:predicted branched-subunit amino acid permease
MATSVKQIGGSEFVDGARVMAPIALSGLIEGAAFGALAATVIGHVAPVVMSLTAFSGSAQYGSIAVLRDGGTLAAALLAAAALNARYLALSALVAAAIGGSRWRRAAACLLLTDAAWAVVADRPSGSRLAGAGTMDLVCWSAGTAIGVVAGRALPEAQTLGLDAAFPALFVWLLRDHLGAREAVAGAALALALTPLLPAGLPLLVAALLVALSGARR